MLTDTCGSVLLRGGGDNQFAVAGVRRACDAAPRQRGSLDGGGLQGRLACGAPQRSSAQGRDGQQGREKSTHRSCVAGTRCAAISSAG